MEAAININILIDKVYNPTNALKAIVLFNINIYKILTTPAKFLLFIPKVKNPNKTETNPPQTEANCKGPINL